MSRTCGTSPLSLLHPHEETSARAVEVKHIIVCSHYGCGGIRAALDGSQNGFVEHWLSSVRDLQRQHHEELSSLPTAEARVDYLCELNVKAQIQSIRHLPVLTRAWKRGQVLTIHGWIYRLTDGRLQSLQSD